MARALYELRDNIDLVDISGGSKPNAIPRYAKAIIAVDKNEIVEIQKKVIILNRDYVKEFGNTDPDVRLNFEATSIYDKALKDELAEKNCTSIIVTS